MSLPKITADYLESNHMSYRICAQMAGASSARAILLKHRKGKVLAVIPEGSFLDLSRLEEVTQCELKSLSFAEQETTQRDIECTSLPALPIFPTMTTVVDEQLLNQPQVNLCSGDPELSVQLCGEDFARLWPHALSADISAQIIKEDKPDASLDRGQIDLSISNFTSLRIRQRLSETATIPPLSNTVEQIILLRAEPDNTLAELSAIVEEDPSLAAQIIRWANSPYFGMPSQVRSVKDAIIRVLGADLVINLALGLGLGKSLKIEHAGIDIGAYWVQSIMCATAMEILVGTTPADQPLSPATAYLVGLFHNFGHLILAHVFPPHSVLVNRYLEVNAGTHHHSIEKHLLGVTREQINACLMRDWDLPDDLCDALRHVHTGTGSAYAQLCFVTCHLLHERGMCERPMLPLNSQMLDELHLSLEDARHVVERVVSSATEYAQLADIFS